MQHPNIPAQTGETQLYRQAPHPNVVSTSKARRENGSAHQPLLNMASVDVNPQPRPGKKLLGKPSIALHPPELLDFDIGRDSSSKDGATVCLQLRATKHGEAIAFKVKTNNIPDYWVEPVCGVLGNGIEGLTDASQVQITMRPAACSAKLGMFRSGDPCLDQFRVECVQVSTGEARRIQDEIRKDTGVFGQLFAACAQNRKCRRLRLKVSLHEGPEAGAAATATAPASPHQPPQNSDSERGTGPKSNSDESGMTVLTGIDHIDGTISALESPSTVIQELRTVKSMLQESVRKLVDEKESQRQDLDAKLVQLSKSLADAQRRETKLQTEWEIEIEALKARAETSDASLRQSRRQVDILTKRLERLTGSELNPFILSPSRPDTSTRASGVGSKHDIPAPAHVDPASLAAGRNTMAALSPFFTLWALTVLLHFFSSLFY